MRDRCHRSIVLGGDDGGDLTQPSTASAVPTHGEPPPFIMGERHAPPTPLTSIPGPQKKTIVFNPRRKEYERLVLESFTSTMEHFRESLDALRDRRLHLINSDVVEEPAAAGVRKAASRHDESPRGTIAEQMGDRLKRM
jgi:hypothetical protein